MATYLATANESHRDDCFLKSITYKIKMRKAHVKWQGVVIWRPAIILHTVILKENFICIILCFYSNKCSFLIFPSKFSADFLLLLNALCPLEDLALYFKYNDTTFSFLFYYFYKIIRILWKKWLFWWNIKRSFLKNLFRHLAITYHS